MQNGRVLMIVCDECRAVYVVLYSKHFDALYRRIACSKCPNGHPNNKLYDELLGNNWQCTVCGVRVPLVKKKNMDECKGCYMVRYLRDRVMRKRDML